MLAALSHTCYTTQRVSGIEMTISISRRRVFLFGRSITLLHDLLVENMQEFGLRLSVILPVLLNIAQALYPRHSGMYEGISIWSVTNPSRKSLGSS